MKLLLQSVRIVYPGGKIDKKEVDIGIEGKKIKVIGSGIDPSGYDEVFSHKGAYVSIGWFDMKANFRDPGDETKETLDSGIRAAAQGGFTGVVLMPSTNPPVQTKSDVEYLKSRSKGGIVSIHPAGSLSIGREGKDITEMFDMKQAGAVAFTDDRRPVTDSGLLLRAMQYAGNVGSLIISYADDKSISGKGHVNEGLSSTIAGMKGMPSFAEELMINRDIKICEYTGGRIHFSTLSTRSAVEMIRNARKRGLPVTAEVSAHQLMFDDSVITDYDTNYKVKPPFRSKDDIEALVEGLMDGTIDVICSDHSPQNEESKTVEFDFAAFGISGIETAFATANTVASKKIGLERLVDAFTVAPRKILNLEIPSISENSVAELTIFDPEMEWVPEKGSLKTKSKNNPLIGKKLRGKALAVYNNGSFLRLD